MFSKEVIEHIVSSLNRLAYCDTQLRSRGDKYYTTKFKFFDVLVEANGEYHLMLELSADLEDGKHHIMTKRYAAITDKSHLDGMYKQFCDEMIRWMAKGIDVESIKAYSAATLLDGFKVKEDGAMGS
jgi:hypothetical protein